MKKFICLLLLLLISPMVSYAQITISHVKEKAEEIKPFDSTKNYLGEDNVKSYLGQVLYVKPLSERIQKYGYASFKKEHKEHKSDYLIGGDDTTNRWGAASQLPNMTRYDELVGKSFEVIDVVADSRSKEDSRFKDLWWFKLRNINNPEEVLWYLYSSDWHKKPMTYNFIVMSYFNYLKRLVGKKYIARYDLDNGVLTTVIQGTDLKTGEEIQQSLDDVWECVDLTIEDKHYSLVYIIQNQKGATASVSAFDKYDFFEESEYQSLVQKYGIKNMDLVRQRKIKVGMSQALLILSWGEPVKINKSSHGDEQWVYSDDYVYVKNKIITAWN